MELEAMRQAEWKHRDDTPQGVMISMLYQIAVGLDEILREMQGLRNDLQEIKRLPPG